MTNEDEGSKPGQQQPESEVKCDKEQYERLLRCSEKKDITEWNKWRKEHRDEEIHLENANLTGAHLENVILRRAYMENAVLRKTHLENANLVEAHLENAHLFRAHLENAKLWETHLENAYLGSAHLQNANLSDARLENALLMGAHLQGARFWYARLQGADFSRAIVDGETLFTENCKVDRDTKFEAVALGNLRIYPRMRQLLEYNIRRKNWEVWYKGKSKNKWIIKMHQLLTCPVRAFWWVSNYGLSTWRIIFTFFALAFVFAVIYWLWPRCVLVNGIVGDIKGFVHALYFSVVTMTTLGFGDIAANPDNWKGQVLLMVQVILGYVLLGALVTRFAVLFTAGGPAGKFSPSRIKETEEDKKHKA